MNAQGQTICLSMIVKDEARVIRRCLDSVRPLIDAWVIADTGSIDGTQDIIRGLLADIPGTLLERPWVNFSHNRIEAMDAARDRCDYSLLVDADDVLELADNFVMPQLDADAYNFQLRSGSLEFHRKQLVRSALPWRYIGVTHEFLHCDRSHTTAFLSGIVMHHVHDGSRSNDLLKYQRDVDMLEQALREEPENSRYVFYLAQSYRDTNAPELAMTHYRHRVAMGGWRDEVWYSLYQIAKLESQCKATWSETLNAYLTAYQYLPSRIEPLYWIAKHYLAVKEFHLARGFLEWAMKCPAPNVTSLFVEWPIYAYMLEIEYAVCCYYIGEHAQAIATNDRLLARSDLPGYLIDRVKKNRQWSIDVIPVTNCNQGGSHEDSHVTGAAPTHSQLH